jgi:glutamate formiminotransferase
MVLACAVNLSEGRDRSVLDELAVIAGDHLLDVHADADHHRSVFTLAADAPELVASVRTLVHAAVDFLVLEDHRGVHPRFGVVDVIPFSPLETGDLAPAIGARDELAIWIGAVLRIPCFFYGPLPDGGVRTLPEVRRGAFVALVPDTGPANPHRSAGAVAVGARNPLVAYNLWLTGADLGQAQRIAGLIRGTAIRALGFEVTGGVQVSCNLVEPDVVGPAEVYDLVSALLPASAEISRAELVGLLPASLLDRTPVERWAELGLSPDDTVQARLANPRFRKRRS